MSNASRSTATRSNYWGIPIARAIPALIVGLVATFVPDHSGHIGLLLFGTFAVSSGLLTGILSFRELEPGTTRTLFLVHGAVAVITGAIALALPSFGLALFLYLVSVYAAVTAFVEIFCGIREGGVREPGRARDWVIGGIFQGILALIFVFLPAHDVVAVGIFGAYGIVTGVFLVIAGLSLRWGTAQPERIETAP